jgi:hypothetical protein
VIVLEGFFSFSFFSLFSIFLFFLFRELGLCVHIAVAILVEWRKHHPAQFDAKFKKNKDGKKRQTSADIVNHLHASAFAKKSSHSHSKAHKYLCKKGIL